MKRILGLLSAIAFVAIASPISSQELGTITFPNSGSAAAQAAFLEGVKDLHSFQFDEAAVAFQRAQKADPDVRDGVLGRGDEPQPSALGAAGRRRPRRRCSRRSRRRSEARQAKAKLPKEKAFLKAIDVLYYAPGDKLARDIAYSDAMAAMYAQWPDDHEVATWYALSLLGTVRPDRQGIPPPGAGRVDRRESVRGEPEASGRGALHHSLVRRSRSRAARA